MPSCNGMESVDEARFVLFGQAPFEQPGTGDMVSPPDQRTERPLLRTMKVLWTIQILVGEILQVLAFHELRGEAIMRKRRKLATAQFRFQCFTCLLQLNPDLLTDFGLFLEELRVDQQCSFLIGK